MNNYKPLFLNEAYFGKTKKLKEAEKYIEKIITEIKEAGFIGLSGLNLSNTDANKKLEKIFKEEFGFHSMSIVWDTSGVINAYTLGCGIFIIPSDTGKDNYLDKHKRYYDSAHCYDCYVCVFSVLVQYLDLTAGEVMAVILHEIGHNFDNQSVTLLMHAFICGQTFGMSELLKFLAQPFGDFQKFINSIPYLKRLFSLLQEISFHLDFLPISLGLILNNITSYANPALLIRALLGRQGEVFSDRFAASYGYGEETVTLQAKFGNKKITNGIIKKNIYSVPVLRSIYDMIECPVMSLYLFILDEHPFPETRILRVKQALKHDLEDPNIPKEFKPAIKTQYENVSKLYDGYINSDPEAKGLFLTKARRILVDKVLN